MVIAPVRRRLCRTWVERVGLVKAPAGTSILFDELGDPPAHSELVAFLHTCLTLTASVQVIRVAPQDAGYMAKIEGLSLTVDGTRRAVLLGRSHVEGFATVMCSFWHCDPGRWVVTDAQLSAWELSELVRQAYNTGWCHRWALRRARDGELVGLSYDDRIVEVMSRMDRDEVVRVLQARVAPLFGNTLSVVVD